MLDCSQLCSLPDLPSLPSVASQLLELVSHAETDSSEVIRTLRADPAIAAKLVKTANSAMFGAASPVIGLERCVSILGSAATNAIALRFSFSDDAQPLQPNSEFYLSVWHQSLVQSIAAEQLARRTDPGCVDDFALCGLLLEIGRLAFLSQYPREYPALLKTQAKSHQSLVDAETAWQATDHAAIGGALMKQWQLPDAVCDSIRLHHANREQLVALKGTPNFRLFAAMAISAAVGEHLCTSAKESSFNRLLELTHQFYHWTSRDRDDFLKDIQLQLAASSSWLQPETFERSTPLLTRANEQLVQLAVGAHFACHQATVRQQISEQDRRDLELQHHRLQKQALHDPLTKAYNRQFFDEMIETETKRSLRCAAPVAMIFIDLDCFKQINDTYGHPFGDLVLQQATRAFAATIRTSDVLARYGGDEFVVLVNQPTEAGVERLAERLRKRIEDELFLFEDRLVPVTISIGAVIRVPGRNEQKLASRLLAMADQCLYEAKRSGRNRICVRSMVDENERQLMQQICQHQFSHWLVAQNLLTTEEVSKALFDCPREKLRIGELAMQLQYLNADQVQQILKTQELTSDRFGSTAIQLGLLTELQLVHLLSLQKENPIHLAAAIRQQQTMTPDQITSALEVFSCASGDGVRTGMSLARLGELGMRGLEKDCFPQ